MTFTKEQLIEELKSSTQNASGMFEIGEETICALMSMLNNSAPQLPQPAVVVPGIKPDWMDNEFNAGWNSCRATLLQAGNSPVIGIDLAAGPDRTEEVRYLAPPGYVIVPIVPTEDMIINGFESVPDPHFSDEKEWEEYEALSGCRQAARRAELCWAAMIKAAPKQENI